MVFNYVRVSSEKQCTDKEGIIDVKGYENAFVADEIKDMRFCQREYVTSEPPAPASKCCVGKTPDGKTFAEFDNDCEVTGPDGKTTLKLQDRTQAGGCTAGQTPEQCCTRVCCMVPEKNGATMVFDYRMFSSEEECTGTTAKDITAKGYTHAFVADEMQDLKFCQREYVESAGASKCCTGKAGDLNFAEFDNDCEVTGPGGSTLKLQDSTPAGGCTAGQTPEKCCSSM